VTKNTTNIRFDLPLNEPLVVGQDDVIVAGNIVGREDIIAVPADKYHSDKDELSLLRKEKDACVTAMRDMHKQGLDVSPFSDNVWFPKDVIIDTENSWEEDEDWIPDDADVYSDFWDPYAAMEDSDV